MQNYSVKIKNFKFLIVILIFTICIFNFSSTFAYQFLTPLPGEAETIKENLLSTYLSWLFRFALAAAAFLAVLQITIGGIQIIFGGASETARTNAKARISDAIWGLLLALGSFLILSTISPQFTDMKLTIPEIKMVASGKGEKMVDKGEIECFITLIDKEGKEIKIKQGSWEYKLNPEWKSQSKEAIMEECKKNCIKREGFITAECIVKI